MSNSLSEQVKQKALCAGFAAVGITLPSTLKGLPHGWIGNLRQLCTPEEEFPAVKSVIVMAFHIWDEVFNLDIALPKGVDSGISSFVDPFKGYFLSYEIMKNKAWEVINFLRGEGFESIFSVEIPLKPTAVICGLGWQGKNTLLVTPQYGPRINLIAILTDAQLDADIPFAIDLCGDCDKCLRVCPTKALSPYKCEIARCIVYSLECPHAPEVTDDIRQVEHRLTHRPTPHSYLECSRCMDVCPYGKASKRATAVPALKKSDCIIKPLVI